MRLWFLMPFPLRVFGLDQSDEAMAWLSTLPEGPGVTHRATTRVRSDRR